MGHKFELVQWFVISSKGTTNQPYSMQALFIMQ
jgi:hypothetical protein